MKNKIIELKTKQDNDDFQVEYSLIPEHETSELYSKAQDEINLLNNQIESLENKVAELNKDIDCLTNHADGIDYTIAVSCGIITGLIDSFFVGEFSIDRANEWGNEKVDSFVMKIAKSQGYEGDDLSKAVKFLEDKYPIAADSATNIFGGGRQHHLRDFSHHPTPLGLLFSLLTQFSKKVYGTDVSGRLIIEDVPDLKLIGKDIPQKLLYGVIYWFFHLVSDMVGSSGSIKKGSLGTGVPGPLVSLLKEISSLPFFKRLNNDGNKKFSVWVSKLFNGTLLAKRDENGKIIESVKFDLRTEIGVAHEIGRQAIPVLINECVIRAFYFIRRFFTEIKEKNISNIQELTNIELHNILPFKNRTILRMMTIASGTFVAVDLADATIRSATKSGGFVTGFAKNFILRVHFVGLGRFAVAVFSDFRMENKKKKNQYERMRIYNQMLLLSSAKLHYKQIQTYEIFNDCAKTEDNLWRALADNERGFIELLQLYEQSVRESINVYYENHEIINDIGDMIPDIEKNNPGLIQWMLDIL